uniref:TAFH domain-containing protein n=1 Tax=Branchiostoma floridae TaxID=7739 RepID=C3YEN1_BRAFL|eukprot:XP_002605115.1 hypothetical protein BRAFLDRAFT_84214 [Branchiostoma floridae]
MAEDRTSHTDHTTSDDDSLNEDGDEEFNDRPSRLSKEYDPVLVRFYEERGMTVARKNCPLIQEAATESGKTEAKVKNFIGNYRESKGGNNRGFSLVGANKEIGESWKNLTAEEKKGCNKAAEDRRGKETQVKTWSEVSKKLKQLEKLSDELDNLGVETLFVTLYNGSIRAFGSQKDLAKDDKVGGYIENQLKAAEHQRKAAQCLAVSRLHTNPSREDTTGPSKEDQVVAGTSGNSTGSARKKRKKKKGLTLDSRRRRANNEDQVVAGTSGNSNSAGKKRKKDKEAQGNQQHPMASNTASSPLMSSTLGTAVVQPPAQSSLTLTAEAIENVKKCKNFLTTVVKLASSSNQPPERAKNVKELVQNLLDAKIEPEEFTLKLQTEFKSSPQPYLVPLLKKTLPYVRQGLAKRGAIGGMQIPPQTPSFAQAPVAMTTSLVASTSISRQSVVVTTQSQHPPNVRQQAAINTAQMTVNPNLDLVRVSYGWTRTGEHGGGQDKVEEESEEEEFNKDGREREKMEEDDDSTSEEEEFNKDGREREKMEEDDDSTSEEEEFNKDGREREKMEVDDKFHVRGGGIQQGWKRTGENGLRGGR